MINKECNPKFAIAVPIEVKITKEGTSVLYNTMASDRETAQEMADVMSEVMGGDCKLIEDGDSSSTSFSSLNWKKASWIPQGPKPNWVIPKDPSLN